MLWCAIREAAPGPDELAAVVRRAFDVPPTSAEPFAYAALGFVYLVHVPQEPRRAVVKCPRFRGLAAREARQLAELRQYARVQVPEVYLCDPEQDLLVIEYLPGVPGWSIEPPNDAAKEQLADGIVDALLAWHSVKHPAGFGPLDGPYDSQWVDYYGVRLAAYYDEVRRGAGAAGELSEYVRRVADHSLARTEEVLSGGAREAALVHGDYWQLNFLQDANTGQLVGVIDPLDAEWADPELDLIHWEWPWGDEQYLLTRYQQKVALPEGLPLRLAFYRFWYAMQNLARIGWHDAQQDHRLAVALDQAMRVYL